MKGAPAEASTWNKNCAPSCSLNQSQNKTKFVYLFQSLTNFTPQLHCPKRFRQIRLQKIVQRASGELRSSWSISPFAKMLENREGRVGFSLPPWKQLELLPLGPVENAGNKEFAEAHYAAHAQVLKPRRRGQI